MIVSTRFRGLLPLASGFSLLLLLAVPARADLLELVNGDHYSGTVVAMDPTNVEFRSEIQGLVKIPRNKIASINLHPAATLKMDVPNAVASQLSNPVAPIPIPKPVQPATMTPAAAASAAAVQQLRQQGVDPGMMSQIQQQVFGQSSPEASKMFNDMIAGLASGSVSVDDVRAQARTAIQEIEAAKKDMGGDADTTGLLDGYAAILQKFVDEAPAPASAPKPAAPAVVADPPLPPVR
jgi:hypothetical protein